MRSGISIFDALRLISMARCRSEDLRQGSSELEFCRSKGAIFFSPANGESRITACRITRRGNCFIRCIVSCWQQIQTPQTNVIEWTKIPKRL